jgi:hypothetical protein
MTRFCRHCGQPVAPERRACDRCLARRPWNSQNAAKLAPHEVEAIRNSTGPQRIVAERYGVSQSEISRIRSGSTWRGL